MGKGQRSLISQKRNDLWELGFVEEMWKYLENPFHNFPELLKFQDALNFRMH